MAVSDSQDWQFDAFNDGSLLNFESIISRKYNEFLGEYTDHLKAIQEALSHSLSDAWDFTMDPASLHILPYEQASLTQLIKTDNKILNKVMTVLAAVCCEIKRLEYEAKNELYPALVLYGEGEDEEQQQIHEAYMKMGKMLSVLQHLTNFVGRCGDVLKNVVQQLAMLHQGKKSMNAVMNVHGVHFEPVYEHLGDLLTILITLDEIMDNNNVMIQHWQLYKRMIKSALADPQRYDIDSAKLRQLDKLVNRIDGKVFNGVIFKSCVTRAFDDGFVSVTRNGAFEEEFRANLLSYFKRTEQSNAAEEIDQRDNIIGICGLLVLHYHVFNLVEKKMVKSILEYAKKIPGVHVVGNIVWFISDFIINHWPPASNSKNLDRKLITMANAAKSSYLTSASQSLSRDVQQYHLLVSTWMVQMESELLSRDKETSADLNRRYKLLVQGVTFANKLSLLVRAVLNMHIVLGKPMSKSSVLSICRVVEMLKAIDHTFHRRSVVIAESINVVIQFVVYFLLKAIEKSKKRLRSDKKYTEARLDVLSALILAQNALNGPGTKERILICRLAICVALQMRCFKDDELSFIIGLTKALDTLANLGHRQEACDCSFVYWHNVVFPVYLQDLFENPAECHRIHYMLGAVRDCVPMLRKAKHELNKGKMLKAFQENVMSEIKEHLLQPLCCEVETDLRLHIHSHLKLDDRNPFKVGLRDLSHFMKCRPIRFFDNFINLKEHITNYLEETFYNLTTVALHDWKTYGEMRTLAGQKYGLIMAEAHLPSQTLEQGLDVLEIMRNLHIFVTHYVYNLNNQVFVERSSNSKHLNTINIDHISNSIRTHGIGIMNTAVNYTYQLLRKKFFIFSQFLYDEHIKARLIKDIRYYKENKVDLDYRYPYERAEKFNKGIRKLGLSSDGQSYLDQFRNLISQIGNAMGYIRMIRSGGLHCCGNAIRFIPDLEEMPSFLEYVDAENLSEDTKKAATNLDGVISNLVKNFTEGTEYFKMLVDVYAPEFRDPKNKHLSNFYAIIPPMTINYVEHMISAKEKLNRKNKVGAGFTDDGFAMGVAYILKLLDQHRAFDSLHWFRSVKGRFMKEKDEIRRSRQRGRDDEKLQQTMNLTLKRLETYSMEFTLLNYSLNSARIFFRAEKVITEKEIKDSKVSDTESTIDPSDLASNVTALE
ncbi:uncharacterized protein TRIADDRAFT_24562 [Trichoplax adhaerens]|uniref:WASH complex subunit 4 n=1 Tax=Trichoplax adhaerens TaxID=10228 RepID=B3RUF0_TRIAD|nr:hypothetical protein TRIADDRAFT_24562 [Trichoplax adhaerens]EDV25801.1 hypothetical protein TRIADDRAFT_24562 [Trichoplax adhaerens]|eukprot:XP_002111834.1 hypothetical protein TRIADDRAFT_24562 [Trichoplax adhaerens]